MYQIMLEGCNFSRDVSYNNYLSWLFPFLFTFHILTHNFYKKLYMYVNNNAQLLFQSDTSVPISSALLSHLRIYIFILSSDYSTKPLL